jgi:sporulation protein YlmC with PRC-barrel domain
MGLGQTLIDKPVIKITDGSELGKVKDLYLDKDLGIVVGVYLGTEGLLERKPTFLRFQDVMVFGIDAVLARNIAVVHEGDRIPESEQWARLDELQGRQVDTPGGTKIGRIGDVILDEKARVIGFSLTHIAIEGPVAESNAFVRTALVDTGNEDGIMTIDLAQAEREELRVDPGSLFSEPAVVEEQA